MSSKKARRLKKYLERKTKRATKREVDEECRRIMENGSIEEMAQAMGIRLR